MIGYPPGVTTAINIMQIVIGFAQAGVLLHWFLRRERLGPYGRRLVRHRYLWLMVLAGLLAGLLAAGGETRAAMSYAAYPLMYLGLYSLFFHPPPDEAAQDKDAAAAAGPPAPPLTQTPRAGLPDTMFTTPPPPEPDHRPGWDVHR